MRSLPGHLVSTDWLQSNLPKDDLRVVDCRWRMETPGEGRREYEGGHIPGAVHLDVEEHLSRKEGPGRHPLPTRQEFDAAMSGIGVDRETQVIVYDDGKGAPAARLWWLLRYYGHEKVSVLDGGWSLWVKEERPTATEIPEYPKTKFAARPKRKWVVDKEAVDSLREDPEVLLIDARAPERYRGEVEPIYPRAGHIPGSENLPFFTTIDPETGLFLTPEKLHAAFEKMGAGQAKTIICYCGSGITACTNLLALSLTGRDAKLYEGSFSDWSRDANLPVATR